MKVSYYLTRMMLLSLFAGASAEQESIDFFYPYNPEVKISITSKNSPYGDVTGEFESRSTNSNKSTFGIEIVDGGVAGNVSADITVINLNDYVVGIYMDDSSSMGTFSGSIETMAAYTDSVGYIISNSDQHGAIGLYSSETNDSSTFDVDWTKASFTSTLCNTPTGYTTRGIYLETEGSSIATGCDEYIGGTIKAYTESASTDSDAIAIDLNKNTSMGSVGKKGKISAIAEGDGYSTGISLHTGASMGDMEGSVYASTLKNVATGILSDGGTMGTISGSIEAYSKNGTATGLSYNTDQQLSLDGASIKATTKSSMGTAIINTTSGINMSSGTTASSITGNLDAGSQALQFSSGQFAVTGDTWAAGSIDIGSVGGTAQVDLGSSLTLDASTLNFYVNALDSPSSITIGDGSILDLSQVSTINVYLDDGVMESGNFDLTLMDGELTGLADDVSVNYILGDAYSDEFLSYGSADDATSFIVSQNTDSVPEPCTVTLSLMGLAGFLARRRRRKMQA